VNQRTLDALCRNDLSSFTARSLRVLEPSKPFQSNWHIDCVADHLEAVYNKQISRLIINIPPRSLKTHLASVSFPAWCFGKDPTLKFILTSFKFDLAKKMTRKTRIILESEWYRKLYPNIAISSDQNEKHNFELVQRGGYFSSAMKSVTGEGADIQICDDPLNPEEAASPVQRINTIETIRSTLFSRFNDEATGRFILIMQRLNKDDPTGLLLEDGGWHHLKLPAEAINKSYSYSINGRTYELKEGGLLFPERLSREVLDRKQREMGKYNYAGQMLQEPVPIGGGEIKSGYLQYYHTDTLDFKTCNVYILCDPAAGKEDAIKNDNDFTAFAVWALAPDQNYYLVDGLKERLNPTDRIDKLFELHRTWNKKSGKPPRVGYEDIGLSSDVFNIQKKQGSDQYRFGIEPLPKKGVKRISKIQKIRRLIPLFENRQVWLPNNLTYKADNGLLRNFISDIVEEEFLLFPFAPHDDFLDAMAMLFDIEPIFPRLDSVDVHDGLDWQSQDMSVFDL